MLLSKSQIGLFVLAKTIRKYSKVRTNIDNSSALYERTKYLSYIHDIASIIYMKNILEKYIATPAIIQVNLNPALVKMYSPQKTSTVSYTVSSAFAN